MISLPERKIAIRFLYKRIPGWRVLSKLFEADISCHTLRPIHLLFCVPRRCRLL